ncbi:TlpA disulfide reductase family protein [Novosphingobium album (ex Liu et al. 2023)]|uniref:TlpA disulfide reductase family protein n=1 Tax=Novosphingobium album (ex Liu et al. 2023) TaxID=3031130 RepID=A0ABT5WWG4_9SPHN|nr:TlpA disulfide reductase family protein [Novosphingobium album (ex Liu et al. 2023)]MDE8654255.1 TlpA disulfide reductase family protein [Novosphingobium album (ex Liu et al. 2023)]
MDGTTASPAPDWHVERWFNADTPPTLQALRGKVVALHAFQMLCPGCVASGLPQAQRIARAFDPKHLAVIGLHTVFEHHEVMPPEALAVFIREYRLTFPIGVDRPGTPGPIPQTMAAYAMQGTPSLILIDRHGRLRKQAFGTEDDLRVGADIAFLLTEPEPSHDP